MGKINIRNSIGIILLVLIFAAIGIISRGSHLSNLLRDMILPELSLATDREVVAEKISINIFPLFIEAKGVKVLESGKEIVHVPRIKGYIGISGFLKSELVLRRLVLKEPDIRAHTAQLEDIIGKVKSYLDRERKSAFKVVVRSIVVENGGFDIGYRDMFFQGKGMGIEAILNTGESVLSQRRTNPRIKFHLKELSPSVKGWPEVKGEVHGGITLKKDAIEVKWLQVGFYGSKVNTSGLFAGDKGDFQVSLALFMDSFKKMFGLKRKGEGGVSAKGTLHIAAQNPLESLMDMELRGDLYIQTLMELLKVEEQLEGLVDFTGNLRGPLNKLTGTAKAHLRNGNLYNVEVDDLRCSIAYHDRKLHFAEGKGVLYRGRGDAEALVSLTGDGWYSLNVKFSDVDSPPVFKLIGWDPGIPLGKVKGELSTAGTQFNPTGSFSYESTRKGDDVLGRVKRVSGSFVLLNDVITLSNTVAATDKSSLKVTGEVDINASALSLEVQGRTADITDITMPYQRDLTGNGEFIGTVTGTSKDPVVMGKIRLQAVSYEGYPFGEVTGDLRYRKDLLEVREASAVSSNKAEPALITMKGNMKFPEAGELFDLKKPLYDLTVTMKNADIETFMKFVSAKTLKPQPKGRFEGVFTITGPGPKPLYSGTARTTRAQVGTLDIDSASMEFSYDTHRFVVKSFIAKKADSALTLNGSISKDDRFVCKITATKIYLKDLLPKGTASNASVSFSAEGAGTLDDPRMEVQGTVFGGTFKGMDLGEGKIKVSVADKTAVVEGTFFNDRVALTGKGSLRDEMPWKARLDMKAGRYDFLLASLLKDVPEDLLINLKGYADLAGDRNHFSAKTFISQLNVALYGYSFSNESDIVVEAKDRTLTLSSVKMRSGTTSFKASGELEMGRGYNLSLEGTSSLSPLKGFSKKIDAVRGDADFVFSITGKWDDPKINGGVTVSNVLFGMRDIPVRISSLNGYLYIDEDKIVIEKLSGKAGGGDVDVTGIAYLQGLKVKRFYINTLLNNVRGNISKEFPVNINGNLLYRGTPDSQMLSGDIKINNAVYREPVEWKSWLLKAKSKERPRGEVGVFEKTGLNVKLQGSDNVLVNNNVARASLTVDMLVRGTVSAPLLFGRVETQTGIVFFRNNEFRILSARADFSDPKRINPVMNIVAETAISGYDIRMSLEGQLEHFDLSLSSNPSLEQIEILSLLTVGTVGKESKGIQGGIGSSAAGSFLSGQLQDIAQERVKSITGLDRIGMESYTSKVTGKSEPRVTVSKRLIGDRLSVTYSTAFGNVASDVIRLEYNIGNNVSLIGIRDEKGSLGANVKFRFGFK